MRIVSWNCNCKFREKYQIISQLNADIYIIQECENPETTQCKGYMEFAKNHLWIGQSNHKGLGVFAKSSISLTALEWDVSDLAYFLPYRVGQSLDIVAVWAMKPYTANYLKFQDRNYERIGKNTVIIGDFNSNAAWDASYSAGAYTKFSNELQKKGLASAYHMTTGEEPGKESVPTFYLYRHADKPYHMDYCFCHKDILQNFMIAEPQKWLQYSDHIPLIIDLIEHHNEGGFINENQGLL